MMRDTMLTLKKYPEELPLDVVAESLIAYHPWGPGGDMCVRLHLIGGGTIDVCENMREVRAAHADALSQ